MKEYEKAYKDMIVYGECIIKVSWDNNKNKFKIKKISIDSHKPKFSSCEVIVKKKLKKRNSKALK